MLLQPGTCDVKTFQVESPKQRPAHPPGLRPSRKVGGRIRDDQIGTLPADATRSSDVTRDRPSEGKWTGPSEGKQPPQVVVSLSLSLSLSQICRISSLPASTSWFEHAKSNTRSIRPDGLLQQGALQLEATGSEVEGSWGKSLFAAKTDGVQEGNQKSMHSEPSSRL